VALVVHIDPFEEGQTVAMVAYSPFNLAEPNLVKVVDLADLASIGGPDALQRLGELLATRICGNKTVKAAFESALELPTGAGSLAICFRVADDVVHALSWEAIVGKPPNLNQQFVALNGRWPIARIPRGGNLRQGAEIPFESPLKLCAVLSAVGREALEEWNGIYAAVVDARAAGLPIEVTLLAGEEEVLTAASTASGVDARPVPASGALLRTNLRKLAPHLLHFYCHGTVDDVGVRSLAIATARDFDDPKRSTSSVKVLVDELGTDMAATNTWAVVLNMCRGADADDHLLTHAERLVNAGVPVAVGMRRLINAQDAFAFSKALYPSVFAAIKAAAQPGSDRIVRWAGTLTYARQMLRDDPLRPLGDDTWTVPAIYTRPGDFRLVPAAQGEVAAVTQELSENEVVDGAVAAVGEGAPAELVYELRGLAPGADRAAG
jgi:hypothetical protein